VNFSFTGSFPTRRQTLYLGGRRRRPCTRREARAREETREEAQLVGAGSAQAACGGAASSGRPHARKGRRRDLVIWASARSRGEEARALSLSLSHGEAHRGARSLGARGKLLSSKGAGAARVRRTLACGGPARVRSPWKAREEGPDHVLGRQEIDVVLIWCGFVKDGRPATSLAFRWVSVPFLLKMHDISSII
jgi:hypothetical protein